MLTHNCTIFTKSSRLLYMKLEYQPYSAERRPTEKKCIYLCYHYIIRPLQNVVVRLGGTKKESPK